MTKSSWGLGQACRMNSHKICTNLCVFSAKFKAHSLLLTLLSLMKKCVCKHISVRNNVKIVPHAVFSLGERRWDRISHTWCICHSHSKHLKTTDVTVMRAVWWAWAQIYKERCEQTEIIVWQWQEKQRKIKEKAEELKYTKGYYTNKEGKQKNKTRGKLFCRQGIYLRWKQT